MPTINGTSGPDLLIGTPDDDQINGGGTDIILLEHTNIHQIDAPDFIFG